MAQALAMVSNTLASSHFYQPPAMMSNISVPSYDFFMPRHEAIMPNVSVSSYGQLAMVPNTSVSNYDANGSISSYGFKTCKF